MDGSKYIGQTKCTDIFCDDIIDQDEWMSIIIKKDRNEYKKLLTK